MIKKTGKFFITTTALSLFLMNSANAGLFSSSDDNPNNALIKAAAQSNEGFVKKLIAEGYPINSVDEDGNTALLKAAYHGNTKVVKALIKAKANLNATDKNGRTALHWAAKNNFSDIAQLLINAGADKTIKDNSGKTAFASAVDEKNINVARVIDPESIKVVDSEAGFPVVIAAAAGGGFPTTTVVVAGGVAAAGAGVAAAAGGGGGSETSSSSGSGGGSTGGDSGSGNNGGGNSGGNNGGNSGGGSGGGNNGGNGGNGGGNNGGNSGGGSSGGGSSTPPPVSEYNKQGGLAQIHASAAYDAGHTGRGVTVAVVDTGVDLTHSDLSANILSNKSANCIGANGNQASCTVNTSGGSVGMDDTWHGTHVAGIVAATKNGVGMHGVAYDAKIMPVKVLNRNGSGSDSDVAAGIKYAADNGANVINLSLGASDANSNPFPNIKTAITYAMQRNVIVAAATGNDGTAQPSWPAQNAATLNNTVATGGLLAVGSVDSANNISSFSNRCGTTKDWCLVAPGENITSTTPIATVGFDYGYTSGTSMASPQVSGAAAILLSSGITPRQATQKLLDTATDLGATGVDDVYGHGLLNLEAALRPAGNSTIPLGATVNGNSTPLNNTSITTASAFGDALSNSGLSVGFIDGYGMGYTTEISNLAHSSSGFANFSDMMASFSAGDLSNKTQIDENTSIAFEDTAINTPNVSEEDKKTNYRMAFSSVSENSRMDVNYNIPMAYAFNPSVLNGVSDASKGIDKTSFLSFVDEGMSSLNEFKNGNTSFRTGSFYNNGDSGKVFGFVNDIGYKLPNGSLGLQVGLINEEKTLLGGEASGAFALNKNTPTWFYNLSMEMPLSSKVNFYGSYNYGVSFPEASAESLFQDISEIQSYSFKLGVNKTDSFADGDKFDFVVSQPLMVIGGSAHLNLPQGRDFDGNILRSSYNVNLEPTGREIDIAAFYSFDLSKESSINAGAIYRTEPDHVKGADADAVFMVKYNLKY